MNQQPLLVDDVTMYLNKSIAQHTVVLSLRLHGATPAEGEGMRKPGISGIERQKVRATQEYTVTRRRRTSCKNRENREEQVQRFGALGGFLWHFWLWQTLASQAWHFWLQT